MLGGLGAEVGIDLGYPIFALFFVECLVQFQPTNKRCEVLCNKRNFKVKLLIYVYYSWLTIRSAVAVIETQHVVPADGQSAK